MKYSIILLLSIILIAGISAPVYAQTITDHVVINEVDTNPSGDDSQFASEWVELYNPTDSDIDLSGWQIASTTVLKKTLTIPDGTIISSGDFLTFVNEKIWFTDIAESVELRNIDGIVIDKTHEIFDLENDLKSWQRIYDGYSEWKFITSTAGGSNGKLIESSIFSPVIVTLSSDKSSYLFDETAIISGTVSEKIFIEKPYFQPEPILITISGPNFDRIVSLYPDNNLNYETTLRLVQVLGIGAGIYDVSVIYDGVVSETTFSVNSEVIEEIQEETVSSLTVMTGKSEYLPGQLVTITGVTSEIILYESLQFTITDSIGDLVANGNLFTSDGQFETSIFLTTVNPNYGVYTIDVEYIDDVASTTFNVVEDFVDEPIVVLDSIILDVDKSEYFLNDYMTLSGTITNFDSDSDIYYQVVYFTFKNSDGKSPTFTGAIMDKSDGAPTVEFTLTAIPDSSGIFSIDARIAPVIFSEGDYVVKANYGGLIDNESFSIISGTPSIDENPSTGNPNVSIPGKSAITDDKFENGYFTSNVKTIIEKVNRISDNLISISTQNKIIDEQSVKPRVVSGSMITMSKDNQSNVNLRVVSESGICIIGSTDECLVSESTRKPGQIFDVVEVDGLNLNVRYTGPDVRLEKFSILPESSDEFLPDTNWNIEVIKDNEISRFYYKLTYKTFQ
jgi:hypothetical protein